MDVKTTNKVFLSWSKGNSLQIAKKLKEELEIVFQDLEIWISTEMGQGKYEHQKITENAANSKFCICVLDHNNYLNPWPVFEAGMFYGYPSKEIFVILCGGLESQHLVNRGHPIVGNFCVLSSSKEKSCEYIANMIDSINQAFFHLEDRKIKRSKDVLSEGLVELHAEVYGDKYNADIDAEDAFLDGISRN